jgi:hypothetical protein
MYGSSHQLPDLLFYKNAFIALLALFILLLLPSFAWAPGASHD